MNDFPALPTDQLHARLIVVEAAVAAITRLGLAPKHWPGVLKSVEEVEKVMFMRGLPAGCLPLGAQLLQLQLMHTPKRP